MGRAVKGLLILAGVGALLALTLLPAHAASICTLRGPASQQAAAGWRCVEVSGQAALNVRQGPGTHYTVTTTLSAGQRAEADFERAQAAEGYTWVPLRLAAGEGWAITPRLVDCAPDAAPPTPAVVNRDGVLDRDEIAHIARAVVLIGNLQRNRIVASGTGTITTPDGLIVTNAHVVEAAEQVAIGVLDDLNDPPEFRYLADVVAYDAAVDVALVAIRTDLDGRALTASDLGLAHLPATLSADDVFRGDRVYIFGYPGIGDDYLVVTSGSIVSVENGVFDGQRMPVWYRTDAEIAPGSSGGLVVNGDGEFVGIPTAVRSEAETGGRLGGIRPAALARMVLEGSASEQARPPAGAVAGVTLREVRLDHGARVEAEVGLAVHLWLTITGQAEHEVTLWARVFRDDLASTPLRADESRPAFRDPQGALWTSAALVPCCEVTTYDDLVLFLPYSALDLAARGSYPLKIGIGASAGDQAQWLSWEFIRYTVQ